jgi:hypothetical protein
MPASSKRSQQGDRFLERDRLAPVEFRKPRAEHAELDDVMGGPSGFWLLASNF